MDTLPDIDPFLVDKLASKDIESSTDIRESRLDAQSERMSEWAVNTGDIRMSAMERDSVRATHATYNKSQQAKLKAKGLAVPASTGGYDATKGLRPSMLGQARNIRPNAPSNLTAREV